MQWYELFGSGQAPSEQEITQYVDNPLWDDLAGYLRQAYRAAPALSYSQCSMEGGAWKGWNVKYKKGGKTLCSLYPKQGYYVALIAIGAKESAGAELLIPLCGEHTRDVYRRAKSSAMGKSLALEVRDAATLRDVKELIALRVAPKAG